jgi:hypothetical protein
MVMPITTLGRSHTMDDNELRTHIEELNRPPAPGRQSLTARVFASCWPGGSEDRSHKAALEWVRRWRPERVRTETPVCSCATGRCALCN